MKDKIKEVITEKLSDWGLWKPHYPMAELRAKFKSYGNGTKIFEPIILMNNPHHMSIGENVCIEPFVSFDCPEIYGPTQQRMLPQLSIGEGSYIRRFVSIYCSNRVSIGRNVLVAQSVCITDVSHTYESIALPISKQPITEGGFVEVGDGCFLGHGAIILPNVKIGKNSVVGAGAVVTRDVPEYSVAVGNPAKIIKQYDKKNNQWILIGKEL